MQKYFQRLLSAAALAASMSLLTFPQTTALVPGTEEPALYTEPSGGSEVSVTIQWGAMEFTYVTGSWQTPDEGAPYYLLDAGKSFGWNPAETTSADTLANNEIRFENNGGTAVDLTCTYAEEAGLNLDTSMAFYSDGEQVFTELYPAVTLTPMAAAVSYSEDPLTVAKSGEFTVTAQLSGTQPEKPFSKKIIGKITVTVSQAAGSRETVSEDNDS